MPRADLHNALVIDREIYDASRVDASLLDPVVRPVGGLPGPARPFAVVRAYQGPQGAYGEYFVLTDRAGRELYRSRTRLIELSGEMFEDEFSDTLRGIVLGDPEEHTVTFFVDDEEAGSVPVFVQATHGGDPRVAAEETFKQALKKGTILWVRVPRQARERRRRAGRARTNGMVRGVTAQRERDAVTRPVWFVFEGGKVYLVVGETEQQVPGLLEAGEVTLIARAKDERSQVAAVPASVRVVPTDDEEWEQRARAALPKRLNLPDGQHAIERWRERCTLVELTPRFRDPKAEAAEAADRPAAAAGAGAAQQAAGQPTAGAPAKDAAEEIHVEAEIDQEVYDKLVAEGKSERIARAKAKAAFVRREKARLRAERETAAS